MEPIAQHLDVNYLSLLVTLLVQTVALVWWAATINNRVATLEKRDQRVDRLEEKIQATEISASTIVTKLDALNKSINELKRCHRGTDGEE
jgi:putative cell wall-binding protein